jgi:hypothetical protein
MQGSVVGSYDVLRRENRSFLEREVDSVLASWLSGLEYDLLLDCFWVG